MGIPIKSAFLVVLFSFPAWCIRFEVQDLSQRNVLALISDAPLEKVIVQCSLFKGFVELDPNKLESGIQGEIELDLRSCHSGSAIRDGIIQEQILDNKQHPLALIRLKKWAQEAKGSISNDSTEILSVESEMSYRGRNYPLVIPIRLKFFKENDKTRQRLPGSLLRVSGQFELDLSRAGVSVPDKLRPIFSNRVEVMLDAVGSDRLPNDKVILPEGPKPKES